MDGDRRKREEGGKGQSTFRAGDWTVDSPSVCFLILKVGGRELVNTGEKAPMKESSTNKDKNKFCCSSPSGRPDKDVGVFF